MQRKQSRVSISAYNILRRTLHDTLLEAMPEEDSKLWKMLRDVFQCDGKIELLIEKADNEERQNKFLEMIWNDSLFKPVWLRLSKIAKKEEDGGRDDTKHVTDDNKTENKLSGTDEDKMVKETKNALLKGLMQACARKWLTQEYGNSSVYVKFPKFLFLVVLAYHQPVSRTKMSIYISRSSTDLLQPRYADVQQVNLSFRLNSTTVLKKIVGSLPRFPRQRLRMISLWTIILILAY